MQKNLRLVKKGRLPRVDIVVASVRKVRFSLSEQRECIELRKGLKVLIFGVKHKKNLYLQRLRSWPATREIEKKSSFESIPVFAGWQWMEKLLFVGQWLEILESW